MKEKEVKVIKVLPKRQKEAVAEALSEVTVRFRNKIKRIQVKDESDLYYALAQALEDTKDVYDVPPQAMWHSTHKRKLIRR